MKTVFQMQSHECPTEGINISLFLIQHNTQPSSLWGHTAGSSSFCCSLGFQVLLMCELCICLSKMLLSLCCLIPPACFTDRHQKNSSTTGRSPFNCRLSQLKNSCIDRASCQLFNSFPRGYMTASPKSGAACGWICSQQNTMSFSLAALWLLSPK